MDEIHNNQMALKWVTRGPSQLQLDDDERLLAQACDVQLQLQSYCPCNGQLYLTNRRMVFIQAHQCYACVERPSLRRRLSRRPSANDRAAHGATAHTELNDACVPLPLMHLTMPLNRLSDLQPAASPFLSKVASLRHLPFDRKGQCERLSMRVQPSCGSKLQDAAGGNALRCQLLVQRDTAQKNAFYQQLRFIMAGDVARRQLQRQETRDAQYNGACRSLDACIADPVPLYERTNHQPPVYASAHP